MPPTANNSEDVFGGSSSRLLPPRSHSPHKSPSRQSVNARRSTASLRGAPNHAHAVDDDAANGRHHSLAHELAAALMPEPSAGSKLLAEEFGIEYDEGAEGIDEDSHEKGGVFANGGPSFADELGGQALDTSFQEDPQPITEDIPQYDTLSFGDPLPSSDQKKRPEQDAMDLFAQDLASTDKFLSHLRRLDVDSGTSLAQPALEKIASDVIRRINDTARDREGQVRELLGYEREFRKISGEVGGNDVLSQLEELEDTADLSEKASSPVTSRPEGRPLAAVEEEVSSGSLANDWEMDPDRSRLGDEEDLASESLSPVKDSFPAPPPVNGPATPGKTISQLAHLRTFTTSLVTSLSTISEQAQVNGVATTEAGRKIRSLKNKIGGWRTDWDSAERSRVKIEKWEAGIDDDLFGGVPVTPSRSASARRTDGRRIVEEHLQAFERALTEAGVKTQAIMAAS